MAGNTIVVRVLGNTRSLSRSLKKAQIDLAGLDRINNSVGAGFRTAAVGAAIFSAAAIGAGAAGVAALAAVPALIGGIGIAFAAMNPAVQSAFSELKSNVTATMQQLAEPLVGPLVRTAGALQGAFDAVAPSLGRMFQATAPLINQFNAGLLPVAKQLGPVMERAFAAGVPVLQALGRMIRPLIKGVDGFFKALEGGNGSKAFVEFVNQLGQSFKQLLPALGRLLAGLAPVGTALLGILIPALVAVTDAIANNVGPAFERLTGAIQEHPTLFRNIGIAVVVFVGAMKAAQLAVALFNGIMLVVRGAVLAFQAVMLAVRAATIIWTNAQWALNIALAANPIGIIIVAIIALVAAFVIAYKKSDTFRAIVDKAFSAIKKVVTTVINFIVNFVKNNWKLLPLLLLGPLGIAVIAVIKNWDKIKSATSAAWNFIKGIVSKVVNAVKAVVMAQFNAIRAVVTAVWNAIKSATTAAWNGIKNAVQTGVNAVLNFVRNLPGQIMGVFANAGSWLLNAGRQIIQGLLDGITDMIGSVKGKLNELTGLIPDWKGPARRDKRLLRPVGRMIMEGLIKGFDDGRAGIKDSLGKITTLIAKAMDKRFKNDKVAAKATKRAIASLKNETEALTKNAKKRESVYKALDKAKTKLEDLRKASADYAKGVVQGVANYTSLTSLNSAFNSDALIASMKARLEKVKQFAALIQDLVTKGLNKTMIDQLVQAGVEGGLATASAIAAGGSDAIAEFNSLQGQIDTAAKGLGDTAAGSMYNAGIQAAQGLIKGLRDKKQQLEKFAKSLAEDLALAVQKALGINSPSRVFKELGKQTVLGLELGIRDTSGVKRGMVNLATAMTNSFARPQLAASVAGGGGMGGNTYNITVNAPVNVDKAAMGREIVASIDAFERKGGRRRAF